MSDTENTPLTKPKKKKPYEMTPARVAAIERMVAARRKNQDEAKAKATPKPVITEVKSETAKESETAEPQKKKKPPVQKIVEESEDEDEEPEVIIVKKKPKRKPKIIIEESSSEEDEPIIVKRKKETPKEVKPPKPSRMLQVAVPPKETPKEPEKIDYKSFFY
jgi:hypothetical protein